MEILLVRFTREQRVFIRQMAKKCKISEAAFVRVLVDDFKFRKTTGKDFI